MLIIQSLDLLLKLVFCGYLGIIVMLLQALFTVPLIAICSYLFFRFKKAYSRNTMKNLITISTLMMMENGLNAILRMMVGLKAFLSQDEQKVWALFNFVLPVTFGVIWLNIRVVVTAEKLFYGAPISSLKQEK